MSERYILKDGNVFDKIESRNMTLEEIVNILNKHHDREWDIYVNNGW